jgi:hypothetical protein
VGSSIRTRKSWPHIYRDSSGKRSGKSRADAADAACGPRKLWQLPRRTIMLPAEAGEEDHGPEMNGSVLQLVAFVVLAAIVLATGFGALGAPL